MKERIRLELGRLSGSRLRQARAEVRVGVCRPPSSGRSRVSQREAAVAARAARNLRQRAAAAALSSRFAEMVVRRLHGEQIEPRAVDIGYEVVIRESTGSAPEYPNDAFEAIIVEEAAAPATTGRSR